VARTAGVLLAALLLGAAACTGSPAHRSTSSPPPASTAPSTAPSGVSYADYCGQVANPDCPAGGVPASLRRPLHPPRAAAGECPVTQPIREVSAEFGAAAGPGPIYPVGLDAHAALSFIWPPPPGSVAPPGWGGNKVLWIGAPTYTGPVLIRGVRLDGDSPVAFQAGGGNPALPEMQFPPGPPENVSATGWRNWPSATLLKAPGCYAWQIDGTTFSTVVVFNAEIHQ
jgi:hypothetical protein